MAKNTANTENTIQEDEPIIHNMQFLLPGAEVLVGGINAIVVATKIYANNRITYEVVWWDGGQRFIEELESFEISLEETAEKTIKGFSQ